MKPQFALIVFGLISSVASKQGNEEQRRLNLPFEIDPNVSHRRQGKCDRRTGACTDFWWRKNGLSDRKDKQRWVEKDKSGACAPKSCNVGDCKVTVSGNRNRQKKSATCW
ncbi:unnamed protein product [Clonostachys rosea f. rosea IK726]|uniref:Uncharacterized protein n=2 Tax=Bionectria ochroleuca TaxID=29856 RepID=A0A0B7JRY8_BIOOC|nr:unnamed protein product [Clonostachys rosea f. rosea IK726]